MNTKALRQKILDLAIRGKLVPPVCRQAGKTLTTNPLPPINGVDCWFTYVIECEDGTFYKGFTHDLLNRYKEHCKGVGADYTRVHKPKQLYYWEMHYSQEKAILREKYLKSGVGREWFKREVVEKPENWEPASVLLDRIRAEKARLSADRERLIKEGKIKRSKKNATSNTPHYEKLPYGWCYTTLGELFTLQAGKNITSSDISNNKTDDSQYPCYGGNGLRGYVKSFNREGRYPLIGRQGALCGNINVADGKFYATEHAVVVDMYDETNIDWAVYSLTQMNLNQYATSTAQPGLAVSTINDVVIALPPSAEQKRIAKAISEWMRLINNVELDKSDLLELIAQTKSKILDLAIRGKLVEQDKNDEPASELLKRINPEWESSESEDSDSVPQGWCACNFDDVFSTVSDKPYQIKQKEILPEGSYPVVTQSYVNLIEGYSDNSEKLYSIETPLILFGDHTRAVKYIDFDFIVGADGTKLILPKIAPKYSYYLISHLSTKIENKGYSRHFGQIRCYPIILPPLPEQHRIVAKIEELFAALDSIGQALVDDNLIRCRFVLQLRSRAVSS